MDGVLVIDKPKGITSHDVVAQIRRLTGEKRVGHAGTLDPEATGVLPILIGRATKISPWLMREDKTYEGTIAFGVETDTLDGEGRVVSTSNAKRITEKDVAGAVKRFRGRQEQKPPVFSAVKIKGQPAYKGARQGTTVSPPARFIEVYEIKIIGFRPGEIAEADIEVRCSKGTYIRSLARDVGEALGCGGHLKRLRRTAAGSFLIDTALKLADVEAIAAEGTLGEHLIGMTQALNDIPKATVDPAFLNTAINGGVLTAKALKVKKSGNNIDGIVAVVDDLDKLIGVYRSLSGDNYKPLRVVGEGRL